MNPTFNFPEVHITIDLDFVSLTALHEHTDLADYLHSKIGDIKESNSYGDQWVTAVYEMVPDAEMDLEEWQKELMKEILAKSKEWVNEIPLKNIDENLEDLKNDYEEIGYGEEYKKYRQEYLDSRKLYEAKLEELDKELLKCFYL